MQQSQLLWHKVERLEQKLAQAKTVDLRYSWSRLAVFLIGGVSTWAAWTLLSPIAGVAVFLAASLLFTVVVLLHQRLDRWVETLRIWQSMYREKIARLDLDWASLPMPVELPNTPLAVDLDLTGPRSLHRLLDTTISQQGSRLLAAWLTQGEPEPQVVYERQAVVRELASMQQFRLRLQLLFRKLSRGPLDGSKLVRWLDASLNDQRLYRVLPWLTLLSTTSLVLFVLSLLDILPPYWILSMLLYAALFYANQTIVRGFLESVMELDRELSIFEPLLRYLEDYPYRDRAYIKQQCRRFLDLSTRPSRLMRQVRLITTLAGLRMNEVMALLLNAFIPWDYWVSWMAARQRKRMAEILPAWLEDFHELEALISLADFAALHPEYSFPTLITLGSSQPVLSARGLGHPLLPQDRKVWNDLRIDSLGELFIITGSNMSGKSTFLRTVGVNLCLAYAGGPVDASELKTLPFRLYTSIRIDDSLDDGFSYFYAEVKRLKGLLDAVRADSTSMPVCYLIDEIFRGTNNRERLTGSRAYVKALIGAAGVGLIATHDLELATLGSQQPLVRNFHFSDRFEDGKLVFDYLLKPGPSTTTNALKIMEMEGLPIEGKGALA